MAQSLFEAGFRAHTDIHREAITIAEALAMTISAIHGGMKGDAAAGAIVWAIGVVRTKELILALEYVGAEVTDRPHDTFRDMVSRGAIRPFQSRVTRRPTDRAPDGKG